MSGSARHPSIVRQITTVTTIVSGASLVLAGIVLGAYDHNASQDALVKSLSIQTQIVAANSVSPLVFNDSDAATSTLAALRAAPNVIAAKISDSAGQPFARFDRSAEERSEWELTIPKGSAEAHRFEDARIVLARRIMIEGKEVGTVSIASDYEELNRRRLQYIGAVTAVLLVSIAAALFMSLRSQRSISEPIVALAATAKRVSSERDYSARAPAMGNARETVVLTDAFNDMLSEIERRDQSLRDASNELEQRVVQRTAELDQANRELEAFSYSVSHDLRAPLRHVTGFAGLLEEHAGETLDERGRKYLRTITTAAHRMGKLIDDLLAFSRMAREHLVKRPVNLNDLVRETRQELMAQYGNDPREIEWTVGDLPVVHADASMLRLVLINLLSNAIKYSAPRAKAHIEIGASRANDEITFFVRDDGVGFDMQYAAKLFGVFQRLHSADAFEGTGIGLANVKRIIHRHGGRVWAEGELDRGATFYFSLPVA